MHSLDPNCSGTKLQGSARSYSRTARRIFTNRAFAWRSERPYYHWKGRSIKLDLSIIRSQEHGHKRPIWASTREYYLDKDDYRAHRGEENQNEETDSTVSGWNATAPNSSRSSMLHYFANVLQIMQRTRTMLSWLWKSLLRLLGLWAYLSSHRCIGCASRYYHHGSSRWDGRPSKSEEPYPSSYFFCWFDDLEKHQVRLVHHSVNEHVMKQWKEWTSLQPNLRSSSP